MECAPSTLGLRRLRLRQAAQGAVCTCHKDTSLIGTRRHTRVGEGDVGHNERHTIGHGPHHEHDAPTQRGNAGGGGETPSEHHSSQSRGRCTTRAQADATASRWDTAQTHTCKRRDPSSHSMHCSRCIYSPAHYSVRSRQHGHADATSRPACHEICAPGRPLEGAVDWAGVHALAQRQAALSPHACPPHHPQAALSHSLTLHP